MKKHTKKSMVLKYGQMHVMKKLNAVRLISVNIVTITEDKQNGFVMMRWLKKKK